MKQDVNHAQITTVERLIDGHEGKIESETNLNLQARLQETVRRQL